MQEFWKIKKARIYGHLKGMYVGFAPKKYGVNYQRRACSGKQLVAALPGQISGKRAQRNDRQDGKDNARNSSFFHIICPLVEIKQLNSC